MNLLFENIDKITDYYKIYFNEMPSIQIMLDEINEKIKMATEKYLNEKEENNA